MRAWLRTLATVAGLFGAAGVGLAALGAHRTGDPTVTTAAYFLLFHAPALVALCVVAFLTRTSASLVAASLLAFGAFLFSGELAVHALAGIASVTLAAPMGGILMILGWLIAAWAIGSALGSDRTR